MTLADYMNGQFSALQYLDFFIRILAACFCGACIGFERSKRLKEAGIRTHIIVCCAAAMMMIVSKYGFVDLITPDEVAMAGTRQADPARLAAQVISGVSFLGAGVIFKNGSSIKGLTTAAGLWATAGIGLAIGAGMYPLGAFATAVIAVLQVVMHHLAVGAHAAVTNRLRFTLLEDDAFHEKLEIYLMEQGAQVLENTVTYEDNGEMTYDMVVKFPHDITIHELHHFLDANGKVRSISYTVEG